MANPDAVYAYSKEILAHDLRSECMLTAEDEEGLERDALIFNLNETGRALLKKIDGKKKLSKIIDQLCEDFDVPISQMERDVFRITDELIQQGLLSERKEIALSNEDNIELIRAVLARGACVRFKANGYSMTPFIRFGDTITITSFVEKDVRVGTVVAFIEPRWGKLIVHRVVGRRGDQCLVKGDNVWCPDGVVPMANILGCIKKTERDGREFSFGLGNEGRWIAFLSYRCMLFSLLMVVWKMIRPIFVEINHE